jgi:predicted DNA-binding protein with PD1-like motif
VKPTLEVIIRETPASLKRSYNPDFGIALIDIDLSDRTNE